MGFTGFYWIKMDFAGLKGVLLDEIGFHWVWLGFTGLYWVLLGFPGLKRNYTEFSLISLGFSEIWQVLEIERLEWIFFF